MDNKQNIFAYSYDQEWEEDESDDGEESNHDEL
jgi:hypothetical protein